MLVGVSWQYHEIPDVMGVAFAYRSSRPEWQESISIIVVALCDDFNSFRSSNMPCNLSRAVNVIGVK